MKSISPALEGRLIRFALGDQVFGERSELLEHTIFWAALFISWRVYTHSLLKGE